MTTFDAYYEEAAAILGDPAAGRDAKRSILKDLAALLDAEDPATSHEAVETVKFMSVADIAAIFGVQAGTVEKWRQRHASFPTPDAIIGIDNDMKFRGWLPQRADEFRDWKKGLPPQGAGGGRPRKNAEAVTEAK